MGVLGKLKEGGGKINLGPPRGESRVGGGIGPAREGLGERFPPADELRRAGGIPGGGKRDGDLNELGEVPGETNIEGGGGGKEREGPDNGGGGDNGEKRDGGGGKLLTEEGDEESSGGGGGGKIVPGEGDAESGKVEGVLF